MMKDPLHVRCKKTLQTILPQSLFANISKFWRLYLAKYFTDEHADDRYYNEYTSKYGLNVTGGPFSGLSYITESAGSVLLLKLVGSYEEILHPVMDEVKNSFFDTVIDIGCAEGYYLVGIGKHKQNVHLIGYDIDERALKLTQKLAHHNKLTNKLLLDTQCTFAKLEKQITDNTLLICDAEGFEDTILNPSACNALSKVKMFIIETHEFAKAGVTETLKNRFGETHNLEILTFKMADADSYPFFSTIVNKKHLYHLLRERGEQEQQWIIARLK
jgi:hypothetical protein